MTTFAETWRERAAFVEDMRPDPGYSTENVLPVAADEADAMANWVESIRWATGHDLEVAW